MATLPGFRFTNHDVSRLSSTQQPTTHNLIGTILFLAYIVAALVLTALIVTDLWRAWRTSPHRTSQFEAADGVSKKVAIAAGFALVSFAMLSFNMLSFLLGSYEVRANDTGIGMLEGSSFNFLRSGEFLSYINQWMLHSTLFQDFAEMITMDPGRLIWTQGALLLTLFWHRFMSINGEGCDILASTVILTTY